MATLSNESVCGANFNKFSLLKELSGTDADQSLEVLESIDRDVSEDEAAEAEPNEKPKKGGDKQIRSSLGAPRQQRDFIIEN